MALDISKLDDTQLKDLVNNRWESSSELWDTVERTYKLNTAVYENRADWLQRIPYVRQQYRVQANQIFVDMESVINSLIAQPPGINILPGRPGTESADFARKLESYMRKKYVDLNTKETLRMGLRNLYFGRLLVIKAFWNPTLGVGGDFDYRAIDPRKLRVAKYARKEQDSEFAIEEINDNLCAVIERFPSKKTELMKKFGINTEEDLYIKNPDVAYKEAWINDYVIFKCDNIILDKIKNPYWDWDGILITEAEEGQLNGDGSEENPGLGGDQRRQLLQQIKLQQDQRTQEAAQQKEAAAQAAQPQATDGRPAPEVPQEAMTDQQTTPEQYKPYFFNYFDQPRKPYIIATIFNNENSPIGRTDMITLSAELQRGIDKRKMDIDENCELANGILKVDSSVMGKADAQRIRFETKGIIWGKGVATGVTRETGGTLPAMVFDDMKDSRAMIDSIMAATSAFKGERQGQETKAGRLALVQQSFLRLNELVQMVDYVSGEVFSWGMQLAKTRYTEYHYAKWMGKDDAHEMVELIQDDFETGSEVTVIAGKTLPVDDEFKYEQAQSDVKEGFISPIDYLQIAKYDNAKDLAKNAYLYKVAPAGQFNITPEEQAKIPPPMPETRLSESVAFGDLPTAAKVQFLEKMDIKVTEEQAGSSGPESMAISFKDMPPDAQVQALAKIGITADPHVLIAEHIAEAAAASSEAKLKAEGQAHSQTMAERSQTLAEKTPKPAKK